MKNLLEAKNVKYAGNQMVMMAGGETLIETNILEDLDATRWNSLAERTNTKSFVRMTGRHPVDYAEVREWVKGLIEGTKKAPAVTGADSVHAIA